MELDSEKDLSISDGVFFCCFLLTELETAVLLKDTKEAIQGIILCLLTKLYHLTVCNYEAVSL